MTIEYRWHPLHKRTLAVSRRVDRDDQEFIHILAEDLYCREIPAWMTERSYCAAIDVGEPLASLESLVGLRAFADAQRLASDSDVVPNGIERKETKIESEQALQTNAGQIAVRRTDPVDPHGEQTPGTRKGSRGPSAVRGRRGQRARRGKR